jgi:asparagine synthase (glutamine-hydrolysing)
MCGICGIARFNDGFALDRELVERMRDTMVHRGPDDRGSWVADDGRVAFGHRRLSIVDLTPAGRGPMSNENGTVWITYNGEVYNHRELREELIGKGHVYRSDTDTETILHLYEEEGPDCLKRLRGMFAIAIWDGRNGGELFLARDRIGIKPLYYSLQPGGLIFGSEIKSLLQHPSISPAMDLGAFSDYLTFVSTPAPRTMFAGINKLAPAECARITPDGRMNTWKFWSPLEHAASRGRELEEASDAELEEELIGLLRTSIERRMMADVPFGVLLSGGVDSSTNVALMSELMDRPVSTFSVAFADHDQYNELGHARRVAEQFGTDHHEVTIDENDLETFLPDLIHHQDEPIADWVCVPLYYVAKLAKDSGTTVVQVGEGSDELFHGYSHYIDFAERGFPQIERLRRLPGPVLRAAIAAAEPVATRAGRGLAKVDLLHRAEDSRGVPYWGAAIAWRGHPRAELLNGSLDGHDPEDVPKRLWDEAERELPGIGLKQRMSYIEIKQRLAELLLMRVDKMTMASSVEARVPFLDHDLVEFAFALPDRAKVRDGEGKWLLKKAVEGLLPNDLIYRKKQGFGAPVSEWFQGDFGRRSQQQIRDSSLTELGLIDLDYVDRLWEAHRSGQGQWSFQLWNLLNVAAWHDLWVAGRDLG